MRLFLIHISLLILCGTQLKSQNNELNMCIGAGANYILGDKITGHRLGVGMFTGLNFLFNKHNRGIVLNPGIYIGTDIYNTKLTENITAKLWSRSIGINLDVLLKVSKKCLFRLGINYSKMHAYFTEIAVKNGNRIVNSFSSDELYRDLSPYIYQAKITAGFCIPVKFYASQSKSRAKLNVLVLQNAIPLLSKDYSLATYKGNERQVIWSASSYPTNLCLSLDVNLIGRTDKKKRGEDE